MNHTFIIIGRSGSGKGTQVDLLKEYMHTNAPEARQFHLYTGDEFRAFIKGDGYSSTLARAIAEEGGLQPSFLAIHMWSKKLTAEFNGEEQLFIDGSPRTYTESLALDSAFEFYGRTKRFVIVIDVSKEEATERLLSRGRTDDTREAVEERVSWFDTTVVPALTYFKDNNDYHCFTIDGEQSIEGVHEDIVAAVESHL